jgi:hypothetical protein
MDNLVGKKCNCDWTWQIEPKKEAWLEFQIHLQFRILSARFKPPRTKQERKGKEVRGARRARVIFKPGASSRDPSFDPR